jgi:hypothetical protein
VLLTGQAAGVIAALSVLKVTGEPFHWANRTWFFPDSLITLAEFTEGLNVFDKKVSVQTDNSFLKIQKTGELISAVVGYKVNNKLEIIWNTSIGADFASVQRKKNVVEN